MKKYIFLLLLFMSFLNLFSQEKFEVFFDFNQDIPNIISQEKLSNWIFNNQNSVLVTKAIGYCDSIDKKDYNKNLALRRINSIVSILEKGKISMSNELEKLALGKDFKQSKIQSENRKVEIYFKPAIETLSTNIKNAKIGDKLVLKNLNFLNRSDVLVQKAKPILAELLLVLIQKPKLKIEIQGHICCQENGDFEGISIKRAKAIYQFLIDNKIQQNRLTWKGFGTTQPLFTIPERTEEQANANRRVEILIIEN